MKKIQNVASLLGFFLCFAMFLSLGIWNAQAQLVEGVSGTNKFVVLNYTNSSGQELIFKVVSSGHVSLRVKVNGQKIDLAKDILKKEMERLISGKEIRLGNTQFSIKCNSLERKRFYSTTEGRDAYFCVLLSKKFSIEGNTIICEGFDEKKSLVIPPT